MSSVCVEREADIGIKSCSREKVQWMQRPCGRNRFCELKERKEELVWLGHGKEGVEGRGRGWPGRLCGPVMRTGFDGR